MATKAKEKGNEITAGGSIEVGGNIYAPGQEEELAAVITSEQVEGLVKAGAIRGFKGAPSAKAREASAKKAGAEEAGKMSRRAAREPLGAQVGGQQSLTGDEAALLSGGSKAGQPGPGVEGNPGKDRSISVRGKSGADAPAAGKGTDSSEDRDPESMTIAELGDALGDNVPEKGSGSNGQVTKKDLVKAYKKHNK